MADDILHLHGIAQQLRKRRYAEGSLRLDNVKIGFELDAHGNPIGSSAYAQRHGLHWSRFPYRHLSLRTGHNLNSSPSHRTAGF